MENKDIKLKKPLYKNIFIKHKEAGYVECYVNNKEGSEEIIDKKAFIYYEDVEEGDIWILKYNEKRGNYSYYSNFFDSLYYEKRFELNKIYKGKIIKETEKECIVRVTKDKYVRIYANECIKNSDGTVEFVLVKNKKKGYRIDCNRVFLEKFCNNLLKENTAKKKLLIKDIEKIEKGEEIVGYNYKVYSEEYGMTFTIFIKNGTKKDTPFYLIKNYEIKSIKINSKEEVTGYFSLNTTEYKKTGNIFFSLNTHEEFKEKIKEKEENNEYFLTELKCNELDETDLNFYIQREDIGVCRIDTSDFSLVELNLLETLYNEILPITLKNEKYIKIDSFNKKEVEYLESEKVIENAEIIKVIRTFSGKIIYQLKVKLRDNNLKINEIIKNRVFFIEENDVDYLRSVIDVGTVFEKLSFKHNIKDIFYFYTRLPHLENPLKRILKDKKAGDPIIGRVTEIENSYINIVINNEYKHTILKEKLKYLSDFEIEEFYEKDKLYEFYIEDASEEEFSLSGYNLSKIIKKYEEININDVVECKVRKKINSLIGYYETEGEVIEVEIPNNEISYLNTKIEFEKNKKYQFSVLNKILENNIRKLILSRKRLSKSVKTEFEYKYPLGSILEGIYFGNDENGLYFNLTDLNHTVNMVNVTGYLPFNTISLYPETEKFKEDILTKVYTKYKIKKFPKNFNSVNLRDKSVLLGLEKESETIEEVLSKIDFENLFIDIKNINKIELIKTDENKIYFQEKINDIDIVFSIDKNEFLFETIEVNNYKDKMKEFYLHIIEKKKINPVYESIARLFDNEYSKIKPALKKINKNNNTIEISFKDKIKDILKNIEEDILQNSVEKYLFGDKILNIQIEFKQTDIINMGEYKCRIEEFAADKCILDIKLKTEEAIGKEFLVKAGKKIAENLYIGDFYGNSVVIKSDYILFKNEKVRCILKEIKDKIIMELKIFLEKENILRNCCSYINMYLKNNIDIINLKELQNLITEGREKYKNIEILSKYEINIFTGKKIKSYIFDKEEFSNGAFGKIYKGYNLLNDEEVILKKYSASKQMPEYKSFYNEAKILKELEIDNIMKAYWYDEDKYIGEYIKGKTFREYLKEEHSFKEKLQILLEICKAIDIMHIYGAIIHLDLKPENIMIENSGKIKLIDFGCCQSKYEEYGKYGTLIYSSPHQCLCYSEGEIEKFNLKDDMYSFGIIMYEVFTGKPPYDNTLCEEGIIRGHLKGRTAPDDVEYRYINPSVLNKEIPEKLEMVINKCLEVREVNRYEDMYEVFNELKEIIQKL